MTGSKTVVRQAGGSGEFATFQGADGPAVKPESRSTCQTKSYMYPTNPDVRPRPIADIWRRCETAAMPAAQPPLPVEPPAPIEPHEAAFIKDTVSRFYGPDAVVRSYGPDPSYLKLHVEVSVEPGMEEYDCAGVLLARLVREQIDFHVSKRGTKPRGNAKIAYRQGVIL